MAVIALAVFGVVTLLGIGLFIAWGYKRVPADKVLVVYGWTGGEGSAVLAHPGGGYLVRPIIQGHAWLNLTPLRVPLDGHELRCADGAFVGARGHVVTQISIEPSLTQRAAERLLNRGHDEIGQLVLEICVAQLRETTMGLSAADAVEPDLGKRVRAELEDALGLIGLEITSLSLSVVPVADR